MRKLFKNSFFSFFKNKLAISLLMIIVFLTTATFTMFNSATNAFKKSYDQVMSEGNRHEYTIKELYNIEGDVYFTNAQMQTGANALYDIEEYVTNTNPTGYFKDSKNSKEYLAFKINMTVPRGFSPDKTLDGYVLVPKDDLLKGTTTVYLPYESDDFTGTTIYDTIQSINTNLMIKFDFSVDTQIQTGTDFMGSPIYSKINTSASDIQKIFNNELATTFTKQIVKYQKYYYGIDETKSGQIYNKLNQLNNYKFEFAIESSITNPDFTTQRIKLINTNLETDSLETYKDLTRYDLNDKAKFEMHKTMIDKIKSYPELIYKDVQSVKISSGSNIWKFVKDTNSEVNKIKIFEGTNLPNSLTSEELNIQFKSYITNASIEEIAKSENFDLANSNNGNIRNIEEEIKTTSYDINEINNDTYQRILTFAKYVNPQYYSFFMNYLHKEAAKFKFDWITKIWTVMKDIDGDGTYSHAYQTGWSSVVTSSQETRRYIDPSSFAAIISPTYANNSSHTIKPMSIDEFNKITKNKDFISLVNSQESSSQEIEDKIKSILGSNTYSNSVIHVGATPYFILGIGITPDFAFPIISNDNPIPNTSNQAIVYTNNAGYERIRQSNQGSPIENYIALSFKNQVSDIKRSEVISELSQFAQTQTSWPSPLYALEKYDSSNETVILAPSRISFLEKLNNTISSVSWIVTSLLGLFTAFIVSLVIKKQIDNRKTQLGILLANGYSKLEIASSMMVIGIIVAIIPSILGYIVGHFMQFSLMNIFSNYWTLPIWKTQFSWITLLVTVVAPLIGMASLAFIISLWALRESIPKILVGQSNKSEFLAKSFSKPMKYLGIKTKMGMSLVFSNIGKLTIALVAFSTTIVALSISMNSIGKFNYARNQSEAATNYEYQIDLITPTNEAQLYTAQTLDKIYYGADGTDTSFSYNQIRASMEPLNINSPDHLEDGIFFHAATSVDAKFAAPDLTTANPFYFPKYLKNRIQVKSLLNFNISGTTNPWRIASQMMPENQKNTADQYEEKFLSYTIDKYQNSKDVQIVNKFNSAIDPNTGFLVKDKTNTYYQLTTDLSKLNNNMQLRGDFIDMYAFGLYSAVQEYLSGNHSVPLPYFMIYNNVVVDKGDETYTYIDVEFNEDNIQGNSKVQNIKIRGLDLLKLKNNVSQIKLSRESIDALENFKPQEKGGTIPIVINEYFKEFYNLNLGSKFTSLITNKSDRYITGIKPKQVFQVVGIEKTYNEGKTYTLQSYANDALGLSDIANNQKNRLTLNSYSKPFNGVMTKEKNPLIFKTLPLYSPSGVYPGKNYISASAKNEAGYLQIDKAYFNPDPNWDVLAAAGIITPGQEHLTFPNPNITNINLLMKTYGDDNSISPMQSLYTTVDWTKVSDYQFTSIMDLSSALMNTVQFIVMFIALAFVLLISAMIIADNTRFISTLKVMGYRTREISKIFLSTFIPSLLLALMIAVPISFGILEAIRVAIMGFGHVLIPLYLVGWEIIVAFGILLIGFLIMYYFSQRGLKNTTLLRAFQD